MSEYKLQEDRPSCLECGDEISYGREGKKFCSLECKNRYHNRFAHKRAAARLRVLNALDKNYKILEELLKREITCMDLSDIQSLGYNINYATSYYKVRGRNEYRCFDIKFYCSVNRIYEIKREMSL